MIVEPLVSLASVVVLGGLAQWIAWRVRLPSILLLLTAGFIAGPVTGLIHPDHLVGPFLAPFVSLSVAIILFEGGLNLNLAELRGSGPVVWRLVTVGVAVTWAVATIAARHVVGLDTRMSALLGAILVVTGPTVVMPLLREVRPSGTVAAILKWEGIVIDPIGALFAVIVFEAIVARPNLGAGHFALDMLNTAFVGTAFGLIAAGILVVSLRRYWLSDALQIPVTMALIAGAFTAANLVHEESGLFAVTAMGIALANQRLADMHLIMEFKENLGTVLLAVLFILLSARLDIAGLRTVAWSGLAFVAILILIARPLCVWISTIGSATTRTERLFLMNMAPRGIVAASISSIFALRLEKAGYADARVLVPLTFMTIIGTVLYYGLSAGPIARRLGLSTADPQGVLFIGGGAAARAMGEALQAAGFRVLLVDSNAENIAPARLAGLPTWLGNVLSEQLLDAVDMSSIGRMLAMTSNDEVNILAARRLMRVFGRVAVWQLPPKRSGTGRLTIARHVAGRPLFADNITIDALEQRISSGATVHTTLLTDAFTFETYKLQYGDSATPLFIVKSDAKIEVVAADHALDPKSGQKIIALIDRPADAPSKNAA